MKEGVEVIDQNFVRALAHPVRIEILDRLGQEVASPNLLAEKMSHPLSGVAYHVRVLAQCGALDLVDEVRRRGATEHFYRAKPDAFIGGREWPKVPKSVRAGGVMAASLHSFVLQAICAIESGAVNAREDSALSCVPLAVDEKGWKELRRLQVRFLDLATGIHERSVERLGASDGISVVFGIAAFEASRRLD